MVVNFLSSPLQPQSDTKVIPDKKAILLTGGFLLADSMLEVYHEWEIKKRLSFLYINLHNKIYYLPYVYWVRGWVKVQEAFDQTEKFWLEGTV